MILKGDIIATHDILASAEIDTEMRDEWVGEGRVLWSGCSDIPIGE